MEEYKVLKVLGEGSFGRALLVHHTISDQHYAMKEIRLPMSSSDVENSRKEAVLLAKMKHPNIVAFKESFEANGHLYIVMEYCDGGDLMQKIKQQRGKLFPEDMILYWFVQMCLGVKHIHDKRVLHRDIKSKNVFLTQDGKIKLGDFGSARLLAHPALYACTYLGTPYYVPPEIWENTAYNNKSDIWSLGCILYELCTLKHPFQANSWKHLILKICKGSYSPLPSHYSYELHYLIKQMFKRNPQSRPSANTILTRGCLTKLIKNCLPSEPIKDESSKHSPLERKNISEDLSESTKEQRKSDEEVAAETSEVAQGITDSSRPHRRQWEKKTSSTVVEVLENASLLSSGFTSEEDKSGCVINYSENKPRKQWNKETPQTLMNILSNADVNLAFKTYTIYKPAQELNKVVTKTQQLQSGAVSTLPSGLVRALGRRKEWAVSPTAPGNIVRGPLSSETEASDEVDSEHEAIVTDSERLEPRSDDDDTDFEEDDPDWISELKMILENSDGELEFTYNN